jgi:hypothetical protein
MRGENKIMSIVKDIDKVKVSKNKGIVFGKLGFSGQPWPGDSYAEGLVVSEEDRLDLIKETLFEFAGEDRMLEGELTVQVSLRPPDKNIKWNYERIKEDIYSTFKECDLLKEVKKNIKKYMNILEPKGEGGISYEIISSGKDRSFFRVE